MRTLRNLGGGLKCDYKNSPLTPEKNKRIERKLIEIKEKFSIVCIALVEEKYLRVKLPKDIF